MKSFKLQVGLCALIFACSCILFGCGSDNKTEISSSRKDQKPTAKKKSHVVELLVNGPSGTGATTKPAVPGQMGVQVTTPGKGGESGFSPELQKKIEAGLRANAQVDPKTCEVIPPRKPGERGITQQEVDAVIKAQKPLDPQEAQTLEVIPPRKPGERGITQQEIDATIKAQKSLDPQGTEIVPPSKPGGRGITQQEANAIIDSQKKSLGDASELPLRPPTQK